MHVYFSGIGGAAIGPLAQLAKQAGYDISGSDARDSQYIDYLKKHGISDIHIGQTREQIAKLHARKPIDWFVYSSALPKTDPDHPELVFCKHMNIKATKRDEFINKIIKDKKLKLIAIAGTHGKTTTTAMAIWLFKQLGLPVSYSVGAKISYGEMGEFDPKSDYFVYEADEFDRNFLSFYPEIALITGIDWDHPDIYPSRQAYYEAFVEFLGQSKQVVIWQDDTEKLGLAPQPSFSVLDPKDPAINKEFTLHGLVNRQDAWLVAHGIGDITGLPLSRMIKHLNDFPGVSRRFEEIAPNLYSDYAHTPPKIAGALQLAHEVAGDNVVVVYEGLHNTRQHFIKDELAHLFQDVKQLYIVPSYLAREDKELKLLSPADIKNLLNPESQAHAEVMELDKTLVNAIKSHISNGEMVLCLSAGGGGSLDEWLRKEFN